MADAMKQFAVKVTAAGVSERLKILNDLQPCFSSPEFSEAAVKGVLRFLRLTLPRYKDRRSRKAVERVVENLVSCHSSSISKQFVTVMLEVAEMEKTFTKCRASRAESLTGVRWSCIVVLGCYDSAKAMTGDTFFQLVWIQCLFMHGAASGAGDRSISRGCFNALKHVWNKISGAVLAYAEAISRLEPSPFLFAMIGYIIKYLALRKDIDSIDKFKNIFLDLYVRLILGSRVPLPHGVTENCDTLLRYVNHVDFKETLLPSADKAMLRNPEIVFESFCQLINAVNIDLSSYALDVGKHLATHCHASEEKFHQKASEGFKHLAKQCSDSGAVEKLAKHIFAVINGSEGKLTSLNQKLSLLTAVGNLSYNTVLGTTSIETLALSVIELLLPLLQEGHEATLVHTLSILSLWCAKFTASVPEVIIKSFKQGLGQKSTSSVRSAYIQCINTTFKGDTLHQGVEFVPLLAQMVEKVASQAFQVVLTNEAVFATKLLLDLLSSDTQPDVKLGPFWTVILDTDKQLLVNDKFLSQASDRVLLALSSLSIKLLTDHFTQLNEKQLSLFYKALIFVLTHSSYEIRRPVSSKIKKVISSIGGAHVSIALVKEFRAFLLSQKLNSLSSEDEDANDQTSCKRVSPKIFCECLSTITSVQKAERAEAEMIAIETVFDAHHPLIVCYNQDAWVILVKALMLDVKEFLVQYADNIFDVVVKLACLSEFHQNTLSTAVRIAPEIFIPKILTHVTRILDNPALLNISRDEFSLLSWPEGELYDKSVIESGPKIDDKIANVRREKAYSYKELMDELELRKELEMKKKQVGGNKDEPKLTKKQQELVQNQIQKETATRTRLKELDQQIENACVMLMACLRGERHSTKLNIPFILEVTVKLLQSALSAPRIASLFISLREAVFDEELKDLANLVAHSTLRLLDPQCNLPSNWCEEALTIQATRAVDEIYSRTVDYQPPGSSQETSYNPFSAPTFAYLFYLLQSILKGAKSGFEETAKLSCLSVISSHASLRSSEGDENDDRRPDLLPRRQMLHLCVKVIGQTTGRMQQAAIFALQDVARCASNTEPGSCIAQQEEIDVLLEALQSPAVSTREAAILGLSILRNTLPKINVDRENGLKVIFRLWVARFDIDEGTSKLAEDLWSDNQLPASAEIFEMLLSDVVHNESAIRQAAARALSVALDTHNSHVAEILQKLLDIYGKKLEMMPPVLDQFGRVVSDGSPDLFPARCGIAMAIAQLVHLLDSAQVEHLFIFFVETGLQDRNAEVRVEMLKAAVEAVNKHGKDNVATLLPLFEEFLASAPPTASYDAVRQSVVILLGTLAKHLQGDSPKIKPIVARLVSALSTPSQEVQEAVSNCLPPLVPSIREDASELVSQLLELLLESENYGERKGAAYGLAGLVKGLGILALKQMDIMDKLTAAMQDKKNARHREGALFAFEMLCSMLGRLFEPYVVHLLPNLLLCFGDNNQYIRQAADDTAKAVMSKLSAHGVKLVLPALLTALEQDSWRTKCGSVELLGAMAYCAPKQLSACLPSIVPKLTEVLTDSHAKVQKAGAQALLQIGSVIKNPEIQAMVPVLLEALQDPTRKTTVALQKLLETKFIHFIDSPSLALIMPVVQRALVDRSTDTRKMAAQIVGNMYSLTDQKDLAPYLPTMIPGLKQSLLDPVPEVRSVSARALGTMVRGIGEKGVEDLIPWLMQTLTSAASTVDRSGAAQGLSEVVGGLGVGKLHSLMPDIIQTAGRSDIAPNVRDGYIMMYIYLPGVFGEDFVRYVGPIIPSILQALADETEYVRDTALKAGQRIVNLYADTAIELLLPEVENGLFNENWRIRHSSIQLLGDLLFRISGVSGKMTTEGADEDDNFGTESSQRAILAVLGPERRNRVLAGLYMGRSDTALLVRQAALHVWKVIVTHTPRMLREILPTLFSLLLGCLANQSNDKQQVAARTLGDVVRKLGEKVLPEIIPILEKGLESSHSDQRQGVCIGLSEIMASTSKDHILVYADSLVPTVRKALCDPLAEVRMAAAKTFDNLHQNIGQRALEDIIPPLLKRLDDPSESEFALDGLKQVMAVKSRVILPYLVPQLTAPPVNTRALSLLSSVAGESLNKHLGKILPALMSSLAEKMDTPEEAQELQYCHSVVLSVVDDVGVRTVLTELLGAMNGQKPALRYASVTILQSYCDQTRVDYTDHVPTLMNSLIHLTIDTNVKILNASWDCLNTIIKKLDASDMIQYISHIRKAIKFAVSDLKQGEELPGFCLPKKGIAPILIIFREGILNGSPEVKESAALGLGEAIKRTDAEALKPSVINITGPLIRILGDRFSSTVKVAMLDTIGLLLGKCSATMKPFLPQMQTTFMKALNDANRAVRLKSADALGKLITIHMRVDPVFTELIANVKAADDSAIRDTMIQAIRLCLIGAIVKLSEKVQKDLIQLLESYQTSPENSTRTVAAACLGTLCNCLDDSLLTSLLNTNLLETDGSQDWTISHGHCIGLSVALKDARDKVLRPELEAKIKKTLTAFASADRIPICTSALRGIGQWLKYQVISRASVDVDLITVLVKAMKHDSNEVKQLVAQAVVFVSKSVDEPLDIGILKVLVPMLVMGTKEKNAVVKSYSEHALVTLLKLRRDETVLQSCLDALEAGMKESLAEVVSKALKKIALQPETEDEDLDNTILK